MRSFRYLITAFAAVSATIPAAALAGEPVVVEREGYHLEYVVSRQADGSRLIVGRELKTDTEFRLRVKGRRVTGEVDGRRVAFTAPRIKAAGTVIASR